MLSGGADQPETRNLEAGESLPMLSGGTDQPETRNLEAGESLPKLSGGTDQPGTRPCVVCCGRQALRRPRPDQAVSHAHGPRLKAATFA